MSGYLVFTLAATLGAMGDLAGHERRGSLLWPGRSAITGLMGAALGLRRGDDFTALDALGLAVAPFTLKPAVASFRHADATDGFRDYHTIETVPSAQAKQANSRVEALRSARGNTHTTITLRDYRTGILCGVAVWGDDLERLRAALEKPLFTLFLGRKSCPLSAPLDARIVDAGSPEEALQQVRVPNWHKGAVATRMMTDAQPDDSHVEIRHDRAIDRSRWHFAPRRVAVRSIHIEPQVMA